MEKLFVQFLAILFCTSILSACGYDSYEDCLLGEMKGQDKSLIRYAENLCERKHPYERQLFRHDGEFDITWSKNAFRKLVFTANATDTEYRITKAFIELTKTECKDLEKPEGQFSKPKYDIDFYVTFNEDNIGYYEAEDAWEYECMRTGTLYGIIDS